MPEERPMSAAERRSVIVPCGEGVAIETLVEGSGPAIVLLPSLGRDGLEDFDSTAAALAAKGFCVLRPQPRGIGRSVGPMQGVLLPALADDVAAVVRQQGGGRAVIVGHAYGNFVARMTAAAHPQVVRGVVLAAAAARAPAPGISAAPGIAGHLGLPDEERLAALRLAFFAPGNDPRPWLHGWYPATQAMQAASSRGAVTRDAWWHAGTAPLLELIPDNDPFKPRAAWRELQDELGAQRVTVRVIEGASHALFPERPHAVAEAIAGWAAGLG
jgi:pimeloyl-ACP methyl ester carboxylesterase